MDPRLLQQADVILNRCGRPVAPQGESVVYISKSFLLQSVVPTGGQTVISKDITGSATWCLRAISATVSTATALYLQIQLPNKKFLFNQLMDITQVAGYGSYRYHFSKELPCPPGSKVQVTFDTSIPAAGADQPIVLLFEGAYAFHVRSRGGQTPSTDEYASQLPRYLKTTGQNIWAPCWMSGEGPQTPDGFSDERFIYSAPLVEIALAGPFATTVQIQIEQGAHFEMRRVLMDITADETVTAGSILMRRRLSSGYQIDDDYIDAAKYLGSAQMAKDWHCPAGDAVVLDLLLVDGAGTGSMFAQVHLDGVKRRRLAA